MINLKVNGRKIKIPTSYSDMPFGMFERISEINETEPDSYLDIISIVLELTDEEKKKKLDLVGATTVMTALSFLKKPILEDIPTWAKKSLEDVPIACYKDMQNMAAKKETNLEKIKYTVAVWLCNHEEEVYSYSKIDHYLSKVDQLPTSEVVGLASFFLRRLEGLRNGIAKTASLRSLARTKFSRVLTRWKDSISLIYFQFYAKTLMFLERNF